MKKTKKPIPKEILKDIYISPKGSLYRTKINIEEFKRKLR